MEKTILYSKKPTSLVNNLDAYQACDHEHCKQLMLHVKFLINALSQNVLQEEHLKIENALQQKQQSFNNNFGIQSQFTKAIEEQVEQVKNNYNKLRKQLNQVESDNDELFEENQQLQKHIQKLTDQINKYKLEQQLARSPVDTKNSFYQESTHCNFGEMESKQVPNAIILPHDVELTLRNLILSQDLIKEQNKLKNAASNSQKNEIYEKYEKLIKENAKLEVKIAESSEFLKQAENKVKKIEFQNMQLKKIIKLRNQIQVERHKTINGLKTVIDGLMA